MTPILSSEGVSLSLETKRKIAKGADLIKDVLEIDNDLTSLSEIPIALIIADPKALAAVIAKITMLVARGVISISDQIFFDKVKKFCKGIDVDPEMKAKFCAKLAEDESYRFRMLDAIRKIDDMNKAEYISNAARYFITYESENTGDFFRICNAVTRTLSEDIEFIKQNVFDRFDEIFPYSATVQALANEGIMIRDHVSMEGVPQYKFTQFAQELDQHALSYNNVQRYPNPTKKIERELKLMPTREIISFDPDSLQTLDFPK